MKQCDQVSWGIDCNHPACKTLIQTLTKCNLKKTNLDKVQYKLLTVNN